MPAAAEPGVTEWTEMETLDALDFDQVCEVRYIPRRRRGRREQPEPKPCGKPAGGMIACRGCSSEALICADHTWRLMHAPRVFCVRCKRIGEPREVFAITPLWEVR